MVLRRPAGRVRAAQDGGPGVFATIFSQVVGTRVWEHLQTRNQEGWGRGVSQM